MRSLTPLVLRGAVLSAGTVLGCGSSSAPHPVAAARVFIGNVDGTDAQVALVATSSRTRVYFCGGNSSYSMLTRWFTLDVDSSGAVHAPAPDAGSWSLDGHIAGTDITGSITIADGTAYTFRATAVGEGTLAGLYEAPAPCGKIGLIISQPSAQSAPAGQGACIDSSTLPKVEQVNPIRPLSVAADGTIRVQVVGATDVVAVRPAAAP
jgi:hypothetical protein